MKKILEGREHSCMELFRVIEVCLKRSDLIATMEIKSAEKLKRGNVMFALCTSTKWVCVEYIDFAEQYLFKIYTILVLYVMFTYVRRY